MKWSSSIVPFVKLLDPGMHFSTALDQHPVDYCAQQCQVFPIQTGADDIKEAFHLG